jgi:AcrR family transcriptional regulator
VAAARDLLAAAPNADAVSMRAVADAVGVTPPSLYLHFADKNELIGAVVAGVFADLDRAMLAAGEGVTNPMQRLRSYGLAYVRFAVGHPEHYRIATMDPCPRPHVDNVLADGAFQHFAGVVQECIDAGLFADDDPMRITLELWSAAHGIAALMIAKPFLPWGDPEVIADRVLCTAALGHVALKEIGADRDPSKVISWVEVQQRRARRRAAQ